MENEKNKIASNENIHKNPVEESKTNNKKDRILGLLDKLKGMKFKENPDNESKKEENQNNEVNFDSKFLFFTLVYFLQFYTNLLP